MKITIVVLITLVALTLLFVLIKGQPVSVPAPEAVNDRASTTDDVSALIKTYRSEAIGLSFRYNEGPNDFTLSELPPSTDMTAPQPVLTLALTPTKDYLDEQTRVGGEGSPKWLVAVYENTEKFSPAVWVERNELASNVKLATTPVTEGVVAGANAVIYTIDGLYPARVYAVAHAGYIYLVNASYMDTSSPTYTKLEEWLGSWEFIPTTATKIDPRVACESALAYMTFTDGAAADAFVAECVDGKHPEVIELYKESLGLDGAAL